MTVKVPSVARETLDKQKSRGREGKPMADKLSLAVLEDTLNYEYQAGHVDDSVKSGLSMASYYEYIGMMRAASILGWEVTEENGKHRIKERSSEHE